MTSATNPTADTPRSVHRFAWLLCVTTFPLLWVGGLITTTDAGMAVPDWPGTYGYNMFAYPWQSWVFGPWDLFIEHGHRLLASVVGLLAIGLLITTLVTRSPGWLVRLAVVALALVIFQGVLGGVRVLENERLIAMAHGCTGPLFFALTCSTVALTSRPKTGSQSGFSKLAVLATLTAGLAYLQLVLGAALRHAPAEMGPWSFASLVKLHLAMAGVVTGHALAVAWTAGQTTGAGAAVRWVCRLIGGLVLLQFSLGVATWLVKYGTPDWASTWLPATMSAAVASGLTQTHTVTAHTAGGSLLLGLLTAMATLAWRSHMAAPSPEAAASTAE
ncbi:MAG: COX15/CtaA family protein [Planctomycetota bacterium]